jgi:S-DNA-T family DNA segregation ATPase FtsK/SpoIIIE
MTPEQTQISTALMVKMISLGFRAAPKRAETGPIITNYYFKPMPDALLGKILNKTQDLALAVGATQVSIMRVKDEIQITVPNTERKIIKFDACLHWLASNPETSAFILPILLGKNSVGDNISLDLTVQPHILIAGSTGSGKSVFLSEIICSLAVLKSPTEVKFILVDTKQLDLTLFSDLDHTLTMVDKISDLYNVLDILIKEVRDRTEKMKGLSRNIKEHNQFLTSTGSKPWPYYVLIIDELADVIGQDKELARGEDKDNRRTRISSSLATLAQISRAAGVHIIAATQRPSVQVLSGDIKTNFPTRISFKLPTQQDSRVVLDENGAETLLGAGDFFYKTAISPELNRGHGAFVSTNDIALILSQHENIRRSLVCQTQ